MTCSTSIRGPRRPDRFQAPRPSLRSLQRRAWQRARPRRTIAYQAGEAPSGVRVESSSIFLLSGPASPYISRYDRRRRVAAKWRTSMTTIGEIIDNFAVLDEWDDRYRYLIELGRSLAPLTAAARTDANKV